MNRISLKTAAVLTAASMALFACNPPNSGNVVSSTQAQAAQTVNFGTVTAANPVTVQGNNQPANVAATIGGGLVGGLIGNEIGGGRGRDIATVAGAVGGAAAGNRIAGAATTVQSTEYLVRLDSGRTISVIQAQPSFGIGSRVQVIQSANGTTRLQGA